MVPVRLWALLVEIRSGDHRAARLETTSRKTNSHLAQRAVEADLKPPGIGYASAWRKSPNREN